MRARVEQGSAWFAAQRGRVMTFWECDRERYRLRRYGLPAPLTAAIILLTRSMLAPIVLVLWMRVLAISRLK